MDGLLTEIGRKMEMEVKELLTVVKKPDFAVCMGAMHHWNDMPLLRLFREQSKYANIDYWEEPLVYPFFPIKYVHSLLHWKVLALLVQKTEDTENILAFEAVEPEPISCRQIEDTVVVIDAHCHLDMFQRETRCSGFPDFSRNGMDIRYLISNYCFPHNWPSSTIREEIRKDKRVKLTFGIHPKLVNLESRRKVDGWLADLEILIRAKGVVAVGECGFDNTYFTSKRDLDRQKDIFECQLHIAKSNRLPVVVHCRGDEKVNERCLESMQRVLEPDHPIHRHCFNGSIRTYKRWKACFPNCKFGISPFLLMEKKYPDFRSTVCDMQVEDLVLETDAPYLSVEGRRAGSPVLTYDIAMVLASIFKKATSEIAQITTSTTRKLYRL